MAMDREVAAITRAMVVSRCLPLETSSKVAGALRAFCSLVREARSQGLWTAEAPSGDSGCAYVHFRTCKSTAKALALVFQRFYLSVFIDQTSSLPVCMQA